MATGEGGGRFELDERGADGADGADGAALGGDAGTGSLGRDETALEETGA